jgi:hypothetical protein
MKEVNRRASCSMIGEPVLSSSHFEVNPVWAAFDMRGSLIGDA